MRPQGPLPILFLFRPVQLDQLEVWLCDVWLQQINTEHKARSEIFQGVNIFVLINSSSLAWGWAAIRCDLFMIKSLQLCWTVARSSVYSWVAVHLWMSVSVYVWLSTCQVAFTEKPREPFQSTTSTKWCWFNKPKETCPHCEPYCLNTVYWCCCIDRCLNVWNPKTPWVPKSDLFYSEVWGS